MSKKKFQKAVSFFLLATYMPVALAIGLLHTDPSLTGPGHAPVSVMRTGPNTVAHGFDGYCAACNFTSHNFFEGPLDISLPFREIQTLAPAAVYEHKQSHVDHFSKRAPPVLSLS